MIQVKWEDGLGNGDKWTNMLEVGSTVLPDGWLVGDRGLEKEEWISDFNLRCCIDGSAIYWNGEMEMKVKVYIKKVKKVDKLVY